MLKKILYKIVSLFHIPEEAVKMFSLANEISGINKKTLPSELLPLNTIQLSRGLLNYTVLQSRLNWIFPYWAEKQYNHQSLSFIPRSHLGLSMNVTARNWTAVGNPECDSEPIVDLRGLVTPFKDGWSVDMWMKVNNEIILPSKSNDTSQSLINDLPIVQTVTKAGNNSLTSIVYTFKTHLYIKTKVDSEIGDNDISIIFSIRPFNPEGISITNSISFDGLSNSFLINGKDKIIFNKQPSFVYCSTFEESDSFYSFTQEKSKYESNCELGMASAVAVFKCSGEENSVLCTYNMVQGKILSDFHTNHDVNEYWNNLLQDGVKINTPEDKINSIFKFSTATLLMLLDKDSITPGPFTYHQFWIRDAAFMLNALDKLGYGRLTIPVINSFKKYQDKKGYFRSQQGEWDSNGQVLWCIYRHAVINNDFKLLELDFDSLLKGVKWIDNARLRDKEFIGKSYYGLLPAGMSAEHLGLVDYYYWDNFWSLAGLQSFSAICKMLKRTKELTYVNGLILEYQNDLDTSINKVCGDYSMEEISASCTRGIDCGMIGSVSSVYPTQLYNNGDNKTLATLNTIYDKYFYKGMFFQSFIHSGMNAYLTLHVAHAFLYKGNRDKFWEILSSVVSNSTSTLTYPEAIHPFTDGGAMGDGHHGWAAAEIVLALRDAFVFESFNNSSEFIELVLLAGIPTAWFEQSVPFEISNTPVPGGKMSINVDPSGYLIKIKIIFLNSDHVRNIRMRLDFPFEIEQAAADGIPILFVNDLRKSFTVFSSVKEIIIWRKQDGTQTVSSSNFSPAIKSL